MRYLKDEELQLASRFLFLSMAIVVLKQDIIQIQSGAFKIKEPYNDLIEKMISKAVNERRELRKTMEDMHIRVVKVNKNDSFSSYLFLSGGREEKRNFFNPAIRKHVELIIKELMNKTLQPSHPSAVAKS
ncbi:hypothetical protein [Oceanobacillus bengalensis]|uniref:Uncharacterized protein n=1 Tax=Oceanobacillus bengalensis TaxID=1435466 RepID=A0A494Z8H8_9BACI|nr:hypothetical protein [Oceanobacillus bengalensis]RKQ18826.1 hypothetical protein D8M05_01590 [Oceanobacillus bengalensis]